MGYSIRHYTTALYQICARYQRDELSPRCYGNASYAENATLRFERNYDFFFFFCDLILKNHPNDDGGGREKS